MSKNNDVVIIELDRPRELRYGHKAIKMLASMGVDMTTADDSAFGVEEIEKIIYCGLLSDARKNNETLRIEDMEDLLDQAPSYQHIIDKMQEAFSSAFGGDLEGNVMNPAKGRKNGTGNKA